MCGITVRRVSNNVDILRYISGDARSLVCSERQQAVLGFPEPNVVSASVLNRNIRDQGKEFRHGCRGTINLVIENRPLALSVGSFDVCIDRWSEDLSDEKLSDENLSDEDSRMDSSISSDPEDPDDPGFPFSNGR